MRRRQPSSRPPPADWITGGADEGLLRPGACPTCGGAEGRRGAEGEARGASGDASADAELSEAARDWLARLQHEGGSRAYFAELRGWLAADPRRGQAYLREIERWSVDPLRPLRRPPGES